MTQLPFPPQKDVFDDDDDGWQDMPIIREDPFASGLDEEDQRKYHYRPSAKGTTAANATGNPIDIDDLGHEWRSKIDQNESEYTRLRVNEEDEPDEVHMRTKYLFDEDKAMTPLSQMQTTKNLLTEAQRIAYVGLCALACREMVQSLKLIHRKEMKASIANMELWALKIMGRLYYHMELGTQEQKMIESLADHGVVALDLVPALMTTHTVANPEYDPEEARRKAEEMSESDDDDAPIDAAPDTAPDTNDLAQSSLKHVPPLTAEVDDASVDSPPKTAHSVPDTAPDTNDLAPSSPKQVPLTTKVDDTSVAPNAAPKVPNSASDTSGLAQSSLKQVPLTTKVLQETTAAIPGVSTTLSTTDENVTLDIRWTVLCDLFLILIADSVYDARSRVLLELVALKLGLGWLDVVKFESRVTQALEIQEDIETLEQQLLVEGARKAGNKRRYMMLGLATIGGGLVIGLSAGLLAPVIGLGLAGALTTVGITGTSAFLGGTAGAVVITTGGVLTGSSIAANGMNHRTQQVRTFEILPLHNSKRVNCIITVPGFMNGLNDDVRLPFSVLDPIVGDVFSVLWEPDMIRETGSALKILTGEVLSQIGMTVLQATIMTGLMSALQWPIILTKLGYLIDNPWNNALDRAKGAGRILADVLIRRHLGVRPITLIGFSLGARVIFYALVELAKQKQFGIVQDVFLLGATLTVSQSVWCETRSVVSGRYVNAFARNDWVLNYLFRASSGGIGTVAGLRPVMNVPGLENVDITDKISGHMSYRTFMPLILDQLGFPVFADYFDEPKEPEFIEDRIVVREEDSQKKSGWFSWKKNNSTIPQKNVVRPPSRANTPAVNLKNEPPNENEANDDDLPPRMETSSPAPNIQSTAITNSGGEASASSRPSTPPNDDNPRPSTELPIHAGFDLVAMRNILQEAEQDVATTSKSQAPATKRFFSKFTSSPPPTRPGSTPPIKRPGSASREDLTTASFSRSASTNIPKSKDDEDDRTSTNTGRKTSLTSSFNNYEDNDNLISRTPRLQNRPDDDDNSIPLSDDVIPSWGASSTSVNTTSSPMSSNNFAQYDRSSIPSPPVMANAFASRSLVFGQLDGSASGGGMMGFQADPWSIPLSGKKKTTTPLDGYGTSSSPWS